MEICVDSVQSALNAIAGGASRLELCSCLELGGLTPSSGLLRIVKESALVAGVPVFVLIRPNASDDFLYSSDDVRVMVEDIHVAKKQGGADGIVTGALSVDGSVDVSTMKILMNAAHPLPVTFHRAIDVCQDPIKALDAIIALGCQRILTSGQEPTAWEGRHCIRQMLDKVSKDNSDVIIMPGGGISEDNLSSLAQHLIRATEFHASCKAAQVSGLSRLEPQNTKVAMGVKTTYVCDTDKVTALVSILATTTARAET